ncbi:MAG: CHAT domain-containing protein [Phycisphaerae bacterium]|nr:CHAT domain-containing protein [Saprospiraceae bacterium]
MRSILISILACIPAFIQSQVVDSLAQKQVDSLLNLAFVLTDESNFAQAIETNTAAENLALALLGRSSAVYARACNNHGRILAYQGTHMEAEKWYLKAKDIQKKVLGEQHTDYAVTLNSLATLYSALGDYASAEPLFLQAQAIWEKALGPENEYAGWSAESLGTLYHRMQHFKKAERYYEEANTLRRKTLGPQHPYYASTVCSQASLCMQMGNYSKAESLYLEAKAIQGKALGKLHPDYAHTLDGLAVLYDDYLKNPTKAEGLYLEVKSIREQTLGKNHPDYGWSLGNLGNFYWYNGQYAQAEPLLVEAKNLWANTLGKAYVGYGWSLHKLWALYWSMGDYAKAQAYAIERNQLERAELLRSAYYLSAEELSLYIRKFQDGLDEDFSFASGQSGDIGTCYDDALFYKGFLLNTLYQMRTLALADTANAPKFSELQACERRLAIEYSKPLIEQQQISQLEETANQLEKDLAHSMVGFKEALRQVNWQAVQQNLRPGEVALEFVHYKFANPRPTDSVLYAALLLSGGTQPPLIVPLFEEKQLAALLEAQGQSASTRINALYGASSQSSLHTLIWQPIEAALARLPGFSNSAADLKTIYFSPSGLLHYLNLAAISLPTTQQNQTLTATLADRYYLIELSSTRQLGVNTPLRDSLYADIDKQGMGILYGGIQYDSTLRGNHWNYLKWTDVEVSAIADLLIEAGMQAQLRRGYDATEESFKAIGTKGQPSPRILHLATHGFFYPPPAPTPPPAPERGVGVADPIFKLSNQPMIRAGLVLAGGNAAWSGNAGSQVARPEREDGILTAYEISQMNLRNTELVVLSACETGLGDIQGNEGVYGLQRAFKIAGVKYLIMSLWQVPDFQTQELMTTFYSHWIEDKMAVPEAFRSAQKAMKEKYRDPFFWAGFVLVE